LTETITDTQTPSRKRVWWLLVLLLALLNGLVLFRKSIAHYFGQLALRGSAAEPRETTERWLWVSETLNPMESSIPLVLARFARREGDFDAARQQLARAKALEADAAAMDLEQWLIQAQGGQMNLAEAQLPTLLESAGGDVAVVCEAYALGYMRQRAFGPALTLLEGWAGDYPKDPRPQAWIGSIYAELQDNAAAEKGFRAALGIDPDYPLANFGLGQLLADLKRTDEAIPYLRKALTSDEFGPRAAVALTTSLRSQSQLETAEAVITSALERFPQEPLVVVEFALSLIEQGNYAEAAKTLQPFIDKETRRREIHHAYATALRGLGEGDRATKHFEYAARAHAEVAAANRKIEAASQNPGDAAIRLEIGSAHLLYGNAEDGLLWLQNALQIDPDLKEAHRLLADYYRTKFDEHPRFILLSQQHRLRAGPPPESEKEKNDQKKVSQETSENQQTPSPLTPSLSTGPTSDR